jgi:hypothetical protein
MGFFDVPPPEDDELGEEQSDPEGRWLAGVLPVEQIIGRSDQAAVAVRRLSALPGRFDLDVVAWTRRPKPRRRGFPQREILLSLNRWWATRAEDGSLPAELVRFGIQFPDGGRATNVDIDQRWPDASPPEHGLRSHGGSSSAGQAHHHISAWPVPAAGDLVLVCEWPAYGIAESRLIIDGDDLRAAAARAQPVWPDEPMPGDGSSAASRSFTRERTSHSELFVTATASPESGSEAGEEASAGEPDSTARG